MSPMRRFSVDDDEVRSAKETLIHRGLVPSAGTQPIWLPGEIDRSWRRSISASAARAPGTFPFVNEVDSDSELYRAASPVLDRLEATLQDMGVAIFLADKAGQIVARRVPGRSERARFDNACAAEGFDFSEESIGTNGLGTAMQETAPVFVRGPEHYNEALEHLACAGTGIRHPATGRLVGSLSLAAPADAAEMMMLAMTREGAQRIVDNLSATVGRREVALGRSYQRHRDKGPVIVLNGETVLTNVTGLSFLNVESHARLWEALLSQDWDLGPHILDLDLQALRAQVLAHRLEDFGDEPAFAVEILNRRRSGTITTRATPAARLDPFVTLFRRKAAGSPGTLSVTGPAGSGKLFDVRDWLRSDGHPEPLVLDANDLQAQEPWRRKATDALDSGRTVVLRRLEDLHSSQTSTVRTLADRPVSQRLGPPPSTEAGSTVGEQARLVITADLSRCSESTRQVLLQVTNGVQLPALASRANDIPALVEALLREIEPARRPVLSAATMQVLMRWDWPGNVAELRHVLLSLASEMPGESVSPYHLPERMWDAANRRALTRIEVAERAEIVAALRQANGNRSKAATLLGIGRTTLYRKLRALHIEEDALLPTPADPTDG